MYSVQKVCVCVWGGGGGGGGGGALAPFPTCIYAAVLYTANTNMIIEEKGNQTAGCLESMHPPGPQTPVSSLPLVEILHNVGYRKFMFVKVTVWKSSCLEKSLFGISQIGNGMGHHSQHIHLQTLDSTPECHYII